KSRKGLRRNIGAAGKNQLQRAEDDLARSRLRDKANRAEVERLDNVVTVLMCGDDDDRNRGMILAKISKYRKAVPVRQVKVKQDESDIGMLFDELHRLAAVRCFENGGFALQFGQSPAQCLAQEHVIVDQKNLHGGVPLAGRCAVILED